MMIRPAPTIEEPFCNGRFLSATRSQKSQPTPLGDAASKVPYLGAVICGVERGVRPTGFWLGPG